MSGETSGDLECLNKAKKRGPQVSYRCTTSLPARWVSGDQEAMKKSSAYPSEFGRCWALAYRCLDLGIKGNDLEIVVRDFCGRVTQRLPPPGEQSQEESCSIRFNFCFRGILKEYLSVCVGECRFNGPTKV